MSIKAEDVAEAFEQYDAEHDSLAIDRISSEDKEKRIGVNL